MPASRARLLLACLALLAAAPASATVQVAVSLLPQAFLVERVGGDRVATVVLVGPGDNEATYAPSPGKLAALESAVAWFTLGVPFEKAWLPRIVADRPDLAIVDLAEGLPRRRVEGGGGAPCAAQDLRPARGAGSAHCLPARVPESAGRLAWTQRALRYRAGGRRHRARACL